MKKRLISLALAFCMIMTVLPLNVLADITLLWDSDEEELYLYMLDLGLVDENGSLIEDNSFTLEDGTQIFSTDELNSWLLRCDDDELSSLVTVDSSGKVATAEELMYALSIEYNIENIVDELNLIIENSSVSAQSTVSGDIDLTAHSLELELSGKINIDAKGNDILTLTVELINTKTGRVCEAPHDIKYEIGVFSAEYIDSSNLSVDGYNLPGIGKFYTYTLYEGESSAEFKINLEQVRTNISNGHYMLDGETYLFCAARTENSMSNVNDSYSSFFVDMAVSKDTSELIGAISGDIEISRYSDKKETVPYHFDWSQHNTVNKKVTIDGEEYFEIVVDVPAAKGIPYTINDDEVTYGWTDKFCQAEKYGIGDSDLKAVLENVVIWSKEKYSNHAMTDKKCFYVNKYYQPNETAQAPELDKINRRGFVYIFDGIYKGDVEFMKELTKIQSSNWSLKNPENENFYKQVRDGNWQVLWMMDLYVPISRGTNVVRFQPDWYLPVDWISNNNNKDIRPEELLMFGTITLGDKTNPTIASINTPYKPGQYIDYPTYYPGNYVPITVTFSEPVYGDYELLYQEAGTKASNDDNTNDSSSNEKIVYKSILNINSVNANGYELLRSKVQNSNPTLSKTRTFLYPITELDGESGIHIVGVKATGSDCKDVMGNAFKHPDSLDFYKYDTTILYNRIDAKLLENGIESITATPDPFDPMKVSLKVDIKDDLMYMTPWNNWSELIKSGKADEADTVELVIDRDGEKYSFTPTLCVEGSGKNQKYYLEYTATLDPIYDGTQDHVVEIYINDHLIYGVYVEFTQKAVKLSNENSYNIAAERWYSGIENTIYLSDEFVPEFSVTPIDTGFTYNSEDGIYWTSSDTDVISFSGMEDPESKTYNLTYNQDGMTISVGKEGTATIQLMCSNGATGVICPASNAIEITVKKGTRPVLLFPSNANTFFARQNSELTLNFSSTMADYPPYDTPITAKLYLGTDEVESALVDTYVLDRSASKVKIPENILTVISRANTPSYMLKLTSDATVDGVTREVKTYAYITVLSMPAKISLDGLDNPMFTDEESVNIGWNIENFDIETNPEESKFEFTITKDGKTIYQTSDLSTNGNYQLIPEKPTGLKDYYIVTAKAKNYIDPTWSIASSTITVYRSDALDLVVGGNKTDYVELKNTITGSTTTSPTITTYDGEVLSGLDSAQAIAQIRSELGLLETIGINYDDYDWSILYDTIKWSTSTGDSTAADELGKILTINYREGNHYAPIEEYSYLYYLPQTIMLLCGLRDGTATVTAEHSSLPELNSSVEVEVERLKDKLYLFQFTPAVRTEVSYEDKNGVTHTVFSNNDGSLALFEPDGIASELRTASISSGTSYRGTVSNLSLKSGEGNGIYGELYPLNKIELRQAAVAEITLLKPDGTPYANSSVTLRGGVYRNSYLADERDDAYCDSAKFARNAGETASLNGRKDQIFTTDENGTLTVHMDLEQFISANNPTSVGVGDSLEFIFELRFNGDEYYPEIVTVNGSLTKLDALRGGSNIVTLTSASRQKPFVAAQTINYTGREIDVRTHTGVVGPSSNYEVAILDTTVMLWGINSATLDDTGFTSTLRSQKNAFSVPDQVLKTANEASYPFSSVPLISSTINLTSDSFANYDGSRKTPMEIAIFDGSNALVSTIALPFGLADLTTIEKVEDSPSLISLMANLAAYGRVGGADTDYDYVNTVSDKFMNDALSFISGIGGEAGLVKSVLLPTEDPTRYQAYLWTGIDTTKLEDLNYDQNGISLEPSYIGQDYDSLLGQVSDTLTLSDFQAMADGSYFDDRGNLYGAASGVIGLPIMLVLEGWVTTEIRYNFDKGEWEVITTGGGFKAGVQLEREKAYNLTAYGIPITTSYKIRGGATVDFKTAIRYAEQLGYEWNDKTAKAVNDYLTALRINAYFEFFGGVGHDHGFTAKVGVFGSIEINNENIFLTRKYLKNPNDRDDDSQYLQLDGEAGIRAAIGISPLVTEITLVSLSFSTNWFFPNRDHWNSIYDYWDNTSSGLGSTGWINDTGSQSMVYSDVANTIIVSEPTVKLESRDYLENGDRAWLGGDNTALMSLDETSRLSFIETNSYPYSSPMISDDGSILVYLSDAESDDVTDVEVRYSLTSGGMFPNGTAIPSGDFAGYGDSSLDFDGNADFAGAVWLREAASLGLKAGTEVTEEQQTVLLNGYEVTASIWNGYEWDTTRLTNNGSQEFDPVIAVNENGQAIVAWRSVQIGESMFELTQNRILVKVYDGSKWSDDTYVLYNGSAGDVTGMSAELLADGTASVAFSVNDGENDTDIYYTVFDINSYALEDEVKTIRATTNSYADRDPQLTSVDDVFVLGWSSVQDIQGIEKHDIGLRVFDNTGSPYSNFPESLSDMVSLTAFDGQFTFVKGAESLDALSILWNDSAAGGNDNDVIRAVKFGMYSSGYGSSAPIEVAALPARTVLNSFDAYTTDYDGLSIQAVIQGTTYSALEDGETVEYSYTIDGKTYTGTGKIPTETVDLYSAYETYTNKIKVASTTVDFTTLATESYVPVAFTVTNMGMNVIDELVIELDGAETQTFTGLNILPAQSKTISSVTLTGDVIENLDYTVTAHFDNYHVADTSGTVYLDYPDIGISSVNVTYEQDGLRKLLVTLYNQSPASINKSGRRAVLGIYSDPECRYPIDGKFFENGTDGTGYEIALTGDALTSIDTGLYTSEVQFDIGSYVHEAGLVEIPASGVNLFVKARIEQNIDGEWIELPEADTLNNQKNVNLESLLTRNNNDPTTFSVEVDNNYTTTATITLRNNSLQQTESGTLMAALLDSNGIVLETKGIGNIPLNGEEVAEIDLDFSRAGARVVLRYGEAISTDNSNANASGITIDTLPLTLENFDANDIASLSGVEIGQYLLTVTAENPNATVTVNGETVENGMYGFMLGYYDITLEITITAPDGVTTRTYQVTITPTYEKADNYKDNNRDDVIPSIFFYTLRFNTNGGSEIGSLRRAAGANIDLSSYVPVKAGYVFTGWYSDRELTERITKVKLSGNTIVYAGWREPLNTEDTERQTNDSINPFIDVHENDWFYDDVMYVYESGLMNGMSNDRFVPTATTTRGMIVTVLYRLSGESEVNSSCPFEDVKKGSYYEDAITWAAENGIVNGIGSGRFAPDDDITREQLATILHRYTKFCGISVNDLTADISGYSDSSDIADYAKTAFEWCCTVGMINGTSENTLSPKGKATRAQFAAILHRFCENVMS